METDEILELISQVSEFNHDSEKVNDEILDAALAKLIKLWMKPDVPPAAAFPLIVQLQAYGGKFQYLAMHYTNIEKGKVGTDEYLKKNIYYTMADIMDKLVAALKYTAKNGL